MAGLLRARAFLFAAIALLLLLAGAALPTIGEDPGLSVATFGSGDHAEDAGEEPTDLNVGDDAGDSDTLPDDDAPGDRDTTSTTDGRSDADNDGVTTSTTTADPVTTTTRAPRQRRTDFSGPPVDSVTTQFNSMHTGGHDDPDLPDTLRLLWTRSVNAHTSYPLVVGDWVFTVGSPFSAMENPPVRLYAFDRRTGEDAWPSMEVGGSQYTASLAYGDGRLFVLNFDGLLRAIEPATGEVLWSRAGLGSATSSAPVARDGRVVVQSFGVSVLRASDGALLWSHAVHAGGRSSPIVTSDAVYLVVGNLDVYRFDVLTGELAWHFSRDGHTVGSRESVLYRGRIYARAAEAEFAKEVVVLDAATGRVVGETESVLQPAFHDGIGVFVEPDYSIRAVDLDTGKQLWHYATSDSTPPIIVNDSVFTEAPNERLARLDLYTGALRWTSDVVGIDGYPSENYSHWMQGGLASGRGVVAVNTGGGVAVFG